MANYEMENTRLQSVEDEKDLGILISNSLKFEKQAAHSANLANKKLGLLKHTFKYWTEEFSNPL